MASMEMITVTHTFLCRPGMPGAGFISPRGSDSGLFPDYGIPDTLASRAIALSDGLPLGMVHAR